MSDALKGNKNGCGCKGKKLSEEYKQKLKDAWIKRKNKKNEYK